MTGIGNYMTNGKGKGKAPRDLRPAVALPLRPIKQRKAEGDVPPAAAIARGNTAPGEPCSDTNGTTLAGDMGGVQLNGHGNDSKREEINPYMKNLNRGSIPDQPEASSSRGHTHTLVADMALVKKALSPIGSHSGQVRTRVQFTTDIGVEKFIGGHYITVRKIKDKDEWELGLARLREDFNLNVKAMLYDLKVTLPNSYCVTLTAWLVFDNFQDTAIFVEKCPVVMQHWLCDYTSHSAYAATMALRILPRGKPAKNYDGQLTLIAEPIGAITVENFQQLEYDVKALAAQFGTLSAYDQAVSDKGTEVLCRFEFFRITDANRMKADVNKMNPEQMGAFYVAAQRYEDSPRAESDDDDVTGDMLPKFSPSGRTGWTENEYGEMVLVQPLVKVPKVGPPYIVDQQVFTMTGAMPFASGQAAVPQLPPASDSQAVQVYRPPQSSRRPRNDGWGSGRGRDLDPAHIIDLDKVLAGSDVRTTLMLRNIPHSWTFRELKARVDLIAKNQYDFSYLRIDFEKAQPIGYGFINLTSADFVYDFVTSIEGTRWIENNPRKIAQVSYATTQGIDCIIEKFRNSAVMSEFPDYRPKLWYVAADAPSPELVGTEKPFPTSNNLAKKQRSHDNASTQGLYTQRPSGRHGDRFGRSNYDRGTSRQMQDEAYFGQPGQYYGNYTAAARQPGPFAPTGFPQPMPYYPYAPYPAPQYGYAPGQPVYYPGPPMPFAGPYGPPPQPWAAFPPPPAHYGSQQHIPRALSGAPKRGPCTVGQNRGPAAADQTEARR